MCMILSTEMLLSEVAATVHRDAPTILILEATSGMSWEAIGRSVGMAAMGARAVYYAAVAVCVCDERMHPEMDKAA
jgi:hypothetical protein